MSGTPSPEGALNSPVDDIKNADDIVISEDSTDAFQLTKSTSKVTTQNRQYRKRQRLSYGEGGVSDRKEKKRSSASKRESSRHGDGRHGKDIRAREERKRKLEGETYRIEERSRDGYSKERFIQKRERQLTKESSSVWRRSEQATMEYYRSRSPRQYNKQFDKPLRESSDRLKIRVSVNQSDSSGPKRDVGNRQQKRLPGERVVEVQDSSGESDGEIPVTEKKHKADIDSLIQDLESPSSSDSGSDEKEEDSLERDKESNSPVSSNYENESKQSPKAKQTWKDIANESTGSESEGDDDKEDRVSMERKLSAISKNIYGYTEVQTISTSESDEGKESAKDSSPTEKPVVESSQVVENPVEPMEEEEKEESSKPQLPPYLPALMGCRSVENYKWLNRIEEGTYGVVFRGEDKKTGQIVALKKLKMEKEREGFPITSLREINMLLKSEHPNIVHVREIVVGSNMDKIFIVMDYVEHDLKSLMEVMKQPFLEGEVKTLMIQLLRAVHHLHDNWILHRDLKTSNLLLSHKGILKVADFGLAREYGSPLKKYTPVVVTLWYRCPELLLGAKEYSTAVDMWSVGCIFAELLQHKPLFMGKSEIDQLNQIFKELGTPNDDIWPGYSELPVAKKVEFTKQPLNNLRKTFPLITNCGFNLLNKFLTYDPKRRVTGEESLKHPYFEESPLPVDPAMFPTWPAKSEMVKRSSRQRSPTAPEGGAFLLNQAKENEEGKFHMSSAQTGKAAVGHGFTIKF